MLNQFWIALSCLCHYFRFWHKFIGVPREKLFDRVETCTDNNKCYFKHADVLADPLWREGGGKVVKFCIKMPLSNSRPISLELLETYSTYSIVRNVRGLTKETAPNGLWLEYHDSCGNSVHFVMWFLKMFFSNVIFSDLFGNAL